MKGSDARSITQLTIDEAKRGGVYAVLTLLAAGLLAALLTIGVSWLIDEPLLTR